MTVSGIDVASYQSDTYDTAGLGFVMVKATEGTGYVNPRHAAQVATGRRHALVVGHYHFVKPGPMTAQATYFLQHAAAAPGDVLALDWEDTGVTGEEKDAWIRHVQAAAPQHRVVLYCNRDFWVNRDHTSFAGDGLWIADPGVPAGHPRVEHEWLIHQYSDAGGTDRNVANFPSKAALAAWAAKSATPTPEEHDMAGMTSTEIYDAVWRTDRLTPPAGLATKANATWTAENALRDIDARLRALQSGESAQSTAIAALAKLAGKNVDTAAVVAAVQQAIADAVVKVDVTVGDSTPAKG